MGNYNKNKTVADRFPSQRASNGEFEALFEMELVVEQTIGLLVNRDALALMWRHRKETHHDVSSSDEVDDGVVIHDGDSLGASHSSRAARDTLDGHRKQAVLGAHGDVRAGTHKGVVLLVERHEVGVTRDPTQGWNGMIQGDMSWCGSHKRSNTRLGWDDTRFYVTKWGSQEIQHKAGMGWYKVLCHEVGVTRDPTQGWNGMIQGFMSRRGGHKRSNTRLEWDDTRWYVMKWGSQEIQHKAGMGWYKVICHEVGVTRDPTQGWNGMIQGDMSWSGGHKRSNTRLEWDDTRWYVMKWGSQEIQHKAGMGWYKVICHEVGVTRDPTQGWNGMIQGDMSWSGGHKRSNTRLEWDDTRWYVMKWGSQEIQHKAGMGWYKVICHEVGVTRDPTQGWNGMIQGYMLWSGGHKKSNTRLEWDDTRL